jgi:hypothetical protein
MGALYFTYRIINKRQMFSGVAWIYSAYRFLSKYEQVSCQVLFSWDGAKNRCSRMITIYKPLMIVSKVTFMNLRDY